jgi:two-component system cell cycle sensor histidine kinase/response regulator CckA
VNLMRTKQTATPTILAVDDDGAVLSLLGRALSQAGYHVMLADGGRSAIEKFESCPERVHLLVTDVVMPDLTGPVVAERLTSQQPGLPVLFISGFHDADMVQRFVTAKGFTLLAKPFTIESLLRTVSECLGRESS